MQKILNSYSITVFIATFFLLLSLNVFAIKFDIVDTETIATKQVGEGLSREDYVTVNLLDPSIIKRSFDLSYIPGKGYIFHNFENGKNEDPEVIVEKKLPNIRNPLEIEGYSISNGLVTSSDGKLEIEFDEGTISNEVHGSFNPNKGPPKISKLTIGEIDGKEYLFYTLSEGGGNKPILLPKKGKIEFKNFGSGLEVKVTPDSIKDYLKQHTLHSSGLAFKHLVKEGEEETVKSLTLVYNNGKTIALVSRNFAGELHEIIPSALADEGIKDEDGTLKEIIQRINEPEKESLPIFEKDIKKGGPLIVKEIKKDTKLSIDQTGKENTKLIVSQQKGQTQVIGVEKNRNKLFYPVSYLLNKIVEINNFLVKFISPTQEDKTRNA